MLLLFSILLLLCSSSFQTSLEERSYKSSRAESDSNIDDLDGDCPSSGRPHYVKAKAGDFKRVKFSSVPCQSWLVVMSNMVLFKTNNMETLTAYLSNQSKPVPFEVLKVEPSRPYLLQGKIPLSALLLLFEPDDILLKGFGYTLFQSTLRLKMDDLLSLLVAACQNKTAANCSLRMKKLRKSTILAGSTSLGINSEKEETVLTQLTRRKVSSALEKLSEQRFLRNVDLLSKMNQNSSGDNVEDIANFLIKQLSQISNKLKVSTLPSNLSSSAESLKCVTGWLTGSLRPEELYIIGTSYNTASKDNVEGVAGALEMANALFNSQPASTIIFTFYPGMEGSQAHADYLKNNNLSKSVKLVQILDLGSFKKSSSLNALVLETSPKYSDLANQFANCGHQWDSSLSSLVSYHPFGSDHVSYLNLGMPALLTMNGGWDDNSDDNENVSSLVLQMAKMSTAALLSVMGK